MNKFSAIDLHPKNSVVVVSDEADQIVYQRRLPNDPVQVRAALAPYREELVGVVIEATLNCMRSINDASLSCVPVGRRRCSRKV
jgi:transposase